MSRRRSLTSSNEGSPSEVEPVFGQAVVGEPPVETEFVEDAPPFEESEVFWEDEQSSRPKWIWVAPSLALVALLGWTGFFGWVHHQEMLAGATPLQWSQWISAWAIPAVLIVALWMLIQRNSRREANRFNDAARLLSQESASLESRLKVVNRELSLAREFIASQSRDLESLGRQATERLNESAEYLQSLVHDNSAQIENIGSVSATAVTNMEQLRNDLPVLNNAARDLSSQIGNAGNVAHSQIESLVSGFDRLNQFGEAGERHVDSIREKVAATLASFDAQIVMLGEKTQSRFGRLREISEAFRTDMAETEDEALQAIRVRADELQATLLARQTEQREIEEAALGNLQERLGELSEQGTTLISGLSHGREEAADQWRAAISAIEEHMNTVIARVADVDSAAMDAARRRLGAISEEAARADTRIAESIVAFDSEIERRRSASAERQAEELAELEERLGVFDASIASKREGFEAIATNLSAQSEALFARLDEVDTNIQNLRQAGEVAHTQLGGAADDFADRLARSRETLEENASRISQITDDSVRLLEIIRSSADHSQGTLSEAIGHAEARLSTFGEEAVRLGALIDKAEMGGERLAAHVAKANSDGGSTLEQLAVLEQQIAQVSERAEALAGQTREELQQSIETLSGSAEGALQGLRDSQSEVVKDIADTIAGESRQQIIATIRADATEVLEELQESVNLSTQRGQQTAKTLRDQMAMLNELAGNLEQRVDYARERAEEKIDSDFSRRIALITESLNSSAIDIAKAFDNEVSDTQWANYLKGDRGIFTRRAVRLLDRSESRAVAEVYEEDSEFRDTVNRFIHDFEAMLREVLATRDGNSLAVTMLSSDTGKLYVALAQAIERLRN